MKNVHWIDTGQWPPALALIADKRAYKRFIREQCGDAAKDCPPFPPHNGGCCQKLVSGTQCVFLITVGKQDSHIELARTLAHEATHFMRWMFEHIREEHPGTEAEAYLVEHVVGKGMEALS
jgi:hypothetical protein